jgi:FMN phosphatase YigB (HAD superfamily)
LRSGATGLQIATNIPTGRLVDIGEQVIDATAEDLTTMERALRLANILKKYDIEQRRNKKIKEEIEAQKTYDRIQKEKESAAKKAEKDYQRMMRENFPDMYKEMRELDPNIQMKKELNKLKKNME